MKIKTLMKAATIVLLSASVTSCAFFGGGANSGNAELILIHTTSSVDPSIPKTEKDKSWLKIKNRSELLKSFDSSGNPNIVYTKDLSISDGIETKVKELNKIDLVLNDENYKKYREHFNSNKIEFSVDQKGVDNKSKLIDLSYRIDIINEFKTDVMNMEIYPTYQTFNLETKDKLDKNKYKIMSKMVMKDNSNIFMVYKYNK